MRLTWRWIVLAVAGLLMLILAVRGRKVSPEPAPAGNPVPSRSQPVPAVKPTAAEMLLEGYGDPATEPAEDLRKLHRVIGGYFSVIKDASRFPIGGNEDLAAALRGENPNREIFVRPDHPIFSKDGKILDRWGTPMVVHPEGWRQIGLRSAGPDRIPYNDDDLVIAPSGIRQR